MGEAPCYGFFYATSQMKRGISSICVKNLRFLRHKEMRHITSSRLKQSSFLLDRLHKLKAWSRRKFPVEEQGKPICVPTERGRQHQHAQSCFLAMVSALPSLLFGSDLLRLPSFQCLLHRLPPCSPEPHALPIILGSEPSFPVQRGLQKVIGTPPSG